MQWQEIRNHYPRQWLLIEAIKAHTESNKRILDHLSVVGAYPDSGTLYRVDFAEIFATRCANAVLAQ